MEFKELLKLTLSARKSKFWGRWKSKDLNSEITIYMPSSIERKKVKDKRTGKIKPGPPILCILPERFILHTFLVEYLCSCIFRGNHIKKKCWNRKKDAEKVCIPEIVNNTILKLLDE
jgi:hypothetical protein